jgi:hypothetical protein
MHQAYDVTVIQSSPNETFERAVGVLSGKPVYTVYLEVGTPKSWPLQYCVPKPANNGAPPDTQVINLGTLETVESPYLVRLEMPPPAVQPRQNYALVHGYLTVNGQFRNLSVIGGGDAPRGDLLVYLAKWVFRPAMRDNVPVEVEAILAVPPSHI